MKIGIDIGGSHIGIGVINKNNEILVKYKKDFSEEEKQNIIPTLEEYIIDTLNKIKNKFEIELIGVAIPGGVKNGIILKTVNLGVNNYDITSFLKSIIQVPVIIRNDGKCACIAEYNKIVSEEANFKNANMLVLTIGTGIGGGVIYNGKLLQGHSFEGYEIGHMVIKQNGIPCKCGNKGCFEKYGSLVEHKIKIAHRLNVEENTSGEVLRNLIEEKYSEISDIVEEYLSDLALGISNLINIFEPDAIVLGGGFSHYGDIYLDKLKDKILNSSMLFNKRDELDLRIAELGNNAGIIGATIEM